MQIQPHVHMQDQISNRVEEIMACNWYRPANATRFQGVSLLFALPLLVTLWQYF